MIWRSALASALLATTALVGGAQAADFVEVPVLAPPPPPPPTWSGFYLGLSGGGGATNLDTDFFGGTVLVDGFSQEGFHVEGRAGYDFQFGNFVLGVLGDAHWSNYRAEASALGLITASLESEWGLDILGRLGWTVTDRSLLYAVGGWSWERYVGELEVLGTVVATDEQDIGGWTIGGGIEVMATPNVSVFAEYRFTSFEELEYAGGAVVIDPDRHLAQIGVNYRFGGPGGTAGTAPGTPVNWTGLYLGVAGGGGMEDRELDVLGGLVNIDGFGGQGFLAEGTIGFDYQMGAFVIGALADVNWSGFETTLEIPPLGGGVTLALESQWGYDLLGRAGVLVTPRTLLYALAGASHQEWEGSLSVPAIPLDLSADEEAFGVTLGGGIEVAATDNIFIKGEYRYTDFEAIDFDTGGLLELNIHQHSARLGVNWKFNGLGGMGGM